jgi:hypothetical protein
MSGALATVDWCAASERFAAVGTAVTLVRKDPPNSNANQTQRPSIPRKQHGTVAVMKTTAKP